MTSVDLSVGHGVKPDGTHDPGATGAGWTEQSAGNHLTAACAQRLADYPISVTSVETYTDDPNYVGSVKRINRINPDLAVTFHHDWSGAPEGAFCHWYADGTDGHRAADHIIRAVASAGFSIRTDWHRARPGLYFLSKTEVPAVLVEAGRIGQYTRAELETFGKAAAEGIAGYFGLEPVEPEEIPVDAVILIDHTEGTPDAISGLQALFLRPDQPVALVVNLGAFRKALDAGKRCYAVGRAAKLIEGDEDLAGANRLETAKQVLAQGEKGW